MSYLCKCKKCIKQRAFESSDEHEELIDSIYKVF